jgi:hypothetical protein
MMMMIVQKIKDVGWRRKRVVIARTCLMLLLGSGSVVMLWTSLYVVPTQYVLVSEDSPLWMPSVNQRTSTSSSSSSSLSSTTRPPSLYDLVHTAPKPDCAAKAVGNVTLRYFDSTFLFDSTTTTTTTTTTAQHSKQQHRKIPKIVHLTSKSRCLAPAVYSNVRRWEASLGWSGDWSYLLHDDAAMDRLLYDVEWPEFPHLKLLLQHCTTSGAAKADVWRALVVWQYGGLYSDIDNAPGVKFYNGTVLDTTDGNGNGNSDGNNGTNNMDSYFLIEKAGIPSQYFFAAAPKHPLMYLLIHHCLRRLLLVDNVGSQYTPWVTGPGALKEAVLEFLSVNSSQIYPMEPGTYFGVDNRSMTIDGGKRMSSNPSWKIIIRESIRGKNKRAAYEQMNMKHFHRAKKPKWKDTCLVQIYKQQQKLSSLLLKKEENEMDDSER